ncbi:hypothetical protein [Sphingobacterium sp. UDSM-2020]|uniref:hypothetical protein n=1 Tax=Sphingobacterium sp. UDSM-2020 TaxID=2795738 RepID=UPI001938C6DD|nr:hypothetical protein [Sphingobacterium sp. UDSM-2020]QQD14414.1 hypothetical protein JAZ75_02395 [Sphingobacterium sp. UDSM-2020]
MKRIISFLLLVSLAYQCLGSMGVFVWFESNRSYIAKELCENRARPQMHCNGQCVLMKKLKALEEKSSDKSLPQNAKHETFLCVMQEWLVMPESISIQLVNKYVAYYKAYYSFIHFKNNFRPPRFNA